MYSSNSEIKKKVTFILAAAGQGKRMNLNSPKQFLNYKGEPLFYSSLKIAFDNKYIDDIIIVTNKENLNFMVKYCQDKNLFSKVKYIVEGGKEQKEIAAYTTDDGREVLIKQTMRYENKTQINRIEWHYFINGKFNSIQNLDMRMFFPQELDSYLEWNGFHIIHKYGGFEEEAFNDNSAKQIFVCQC